MFLGLKAKEWGDLALMVLAVVVFGIIYFSIVGV